MRIRLRQLSALAVPLLLLPAVASPAGAAARSTTYNVSPTGSDSATGTATAPFRTIQKCADVMVAGDTCRIAAGVYRERVAPRRDGTAHARITYAAAPGAQVVIDGTDPVTGWQRVSDADLDELAAGDQFMTGSPFAQGVRDGRIYRADITIDSTLPGNQVFVDGALTPQAQWPHPGENPMRPLMASARSGSYTSIEDPALDQPAGYWTGARLLARNWFVSETGTVTSSQPGQVTAASLPNCISLNPNQKTSYALSGKLRLLGHAGQWFYDAGAKRLYLWTRDGDDPSGHTVEAKQREAGLDLIGRSYVTATGLGLRATTLRTAAGSSNNVVERTIARYVSAYDDLARDPNMVRDPDACGLLTAGETTSGLQLGGTGNVLRDSAIDWSAGNGVVLSGTGNTVTGTTITNADYMGSYAAGINLIGSGHRVTRNTVTTTGRSGINIDDKVAGATAGGHEIAHNDVSSYNHLVNDGGAIYVCCNIDLAGTTLHHNLLHDPAPLAAQAPAPGIYLDNNAFNATAYANVAWNGTSYGVVLLNGDKPAPGNRLWNNTSGTDRKSISLNGPSYPDTEIVNNIGDVDVKAGVTASNNIPYAVDPLFTEPRTQDWTLRAESPARNAAVVRKPATDGFRDAKPSAGAYQYGVPKWQGGAGIAATVVQAERYAAGSGVSTHAAGTGQVMGSFDGGDWARYDGVDFGSGRTVFTGSIGADRQYAGRAFEIRLDALTGPVIGRMTVMPSDGFDDYLVRSLPITPTSGVHSVFLVAIGSSPGVGNFDHFSFTAPQAGSAIVKR
ncbi:carbohydrate-binding protein [Actinoplanes solisilvae]|uniref:carbohydrate-binding protein n=1 Tax=Actinoplanes solisilvae TaxID=2486853 RepID=UPI000FDC6D3B|nr:carbohydrate-binding protein [Actinoplanes solisilvae]